MLGEIPRWETELWSYISSGDGMHCPLHSQCPVVEEEGLCLDNYKERINRLLDDKRFILSNYAFIKCKTCGKMYELVGRLAAHYLKKGRIHSPPVPIELVSLADEHNPIEVRLVPLTAHHGAIWRLKDSWIIQLNAHDTSDRRRFTLFHEAFHILAHCRATPVFRRGGNNEGSFNEAMADCFATCIIMPEVWVRERWAEVKNIVRMAEIFDVPIQAMCVRLKWLGLL